MKSFWRWIYSFGDFLGYQLVTCKILHQHLKLVTNIGNSDFWYWLTGMSSKYEDSSSREALLAYETRLEAFIRATFQSTICFLSFFCDFSQFLLFPQQNPESEYTGTTYRMSHTVRIAPGDAAQNGSKDGQTEKLLKLSLFCPTILFFSSLGFRWYKISIADTFFATILSSLISVPKLPQGLSRRSSKKTIIFFWFWPKMLTKLLAHQRYWGFTDMGR